VYDKIKKTGKGEEAAEIDREEESVMAICKYRIFEIAFKISYKQKRNSSSLFLFKIIKIYYACLINSIPT
jgi:hypothetical protein